MKVYKLALSDFSNSRLGSSSAALLEMLGRDSTALRIDLQSANRIVKYADGPQWKGTVPCSKAQASLHVQILATLWTAVEW